jgi:multidrug transporter EmrE-like cation transporter
MVDQPGGGTAGAGVVCGSAGPRRDAITSDETEGGSMIEQLSHTWWLILLSVTASVAGQTVIKLGTGQPGQARADGLLSLVITILQSPLILLGLVFYAVGALAWIAVLQRMDLGYAYPFLALNFVLITLASGLFLGEPVPLLRWAGIALIAAGILVVARTG